MTPPSSPDSLKPGNLVGPWRIEGYAGRGSYGLVFRARHASQPHAPPVALKLAVFPGDPRFLREATLLARLHHPAVPRLLDQGCWHASADAVHPYLAMEWIRGLPLYEWARHHPVSPRQALLVVVQVADALALLHEAEGLHRDLKGDNILVDAEGRAVLTDFGSGTWKGAPPLTDSLMPPNTPEYRSPQALRFHWRHCHTLEARYEATAADDIYALGVTAYRLVTRVYPPPGTSPEELKQRLQTPPARRLPAQALNGHVGPEFSALIERMLAESPEARASAPEVAEKGMTTARHLGSKADGPLFTVDRPAAAAHALPAQGVPVADLERLAVEAPVAAPARASTERPALSAPVRSFLLTHSVLLAVLSLVWVGQALPPEWLTAMQAEASDAGVAPDGGTRGLGEDSLASRVDTQSPPPATKTLSLDLPKQPLPGQLRPPCQRKGAKVIQGGCWIRIGDVEPPCGHNNYEWQGACYYPLLEETRMPTSEPSQK
jgi:eukaryotic-like serine/threonine-protein kinase